MEVPLEEIVRLRLREARADRPTSSCGSLDIVEKPSASEAPSNLAVMGRYVFTPEIFDALEQVQPGVGGEIQLTDAIALLLDDQTVYGYVFAEGRYDIGKKLDYLRATVELALERDDLGPEFRDVPRSASMKGRGLVVIRAGRGPGLRPRAPARPLPAVRVAAGRRPRAAWPSTAVVATEAVPPFANTAMDGFAVRAADTVGATAAAPVRLRRRRHHRAPAWRPAFDARAGRGGADHDRRADARRAPTPSSWSSAPRRSTDGATVEHRRRGGRAGRPRPAGRRRHAAGRRGVRRRRPCSRAGHLGVLASVGVAEVDVVPPAPGRRALHRRRAGRGRRGRSRPGQIRDSNRPHAARPGRAGRAATAVDLGLRPRRRGRHRPRPSSGARPTCDALRHAAAACQHGRLRLREGRARPDRRHALDADRHQAGQAVGVRRRSGGTPGVRPARQPGVVDGVASSCSPARRCAR